MELQPLPQPRKVAELAPEAQAFKSYRAKGFQKEISRIVDLAFSPTAPYQLAVASGTKVGLWKSKQEGEVESDGTISKFKDITQCVSWRSDGKLLLAGEAGGSCAVIEVETRKVLRRFRGHGDAVTCAAFSTSDKTRAATGSRDGRLRLWDVTACELLHTVDAHADCMKFLCPGPGGPDSWISAGYDGKMKLWDLRVAAPTDDKVVKAAITMDHGQPVETAVAFPGGAMLASAGGPAVRLWDLAAGGTLMQAMPEAHSKAVTSMCLDGQASTLLTASFDGFAKVWNVAGLEHLYSYHLPAPILCAAWRADDKAFALGLENGQWQVRHRRTEEEKAAAQKRASQEANASRVKKSMVRRKAIGNLRGLDREAASDEEIVEPERPRKKKESQADFFLRKFEYRKCAEILANPGTDRAQGFALVDELMQRGALRVALKDQDEVFCLAALKWLHKAFVAGNTFQNNLFFEMLHVLLDNNRCLQPPTTVELVNALTVLDSKVAEEINLQDSLAETAGMLQSILSL